jgi:hypothetical protein
MGDRSNLNSLFLVFFFKFILGKLKKLFIYFLFFKMLSIPSGIVIPIKKGIVIPSE